MSEKKMSEQVQEAFDNMTKAVCERIQERHEEIIEALKADAKRRKDCLLDK